jgi:single-strand DNA-binding protein
MAWNETKMTVVGRVCTEISTRTMTDGDPFTYFRIAANSRRYDRDAGTWVNADSLFMDVRCFRRLAQNVAATLRIGDPIVVTGKVSSVKPDDTGKTAGALSLEATCIGPDLSLCEVDLRRAERTEQRAEVVAA